MRQTELAAQAVAHEGARYFDGLAEDGFRITWIAPDGKVLHDSRPPPPRDCLPPERERQRVYVHGEIPAGVSFP